MRNDRSFQKTSLGKLSDIIRNSIELLIRFVDGDRTFYDTADYDWVKAVENDYLKIKSELLQVLAENLSPAWEKISNDPNVKVGDKWKTFVLCGYGHFIAKNCGKCPETYKAILKIKGLKTAWFSIMEPDTVLPMHQGPYNGVLRYHLGLIIPEKNIKKCGVRVGDEARNWEEGKSLIFDDSHKHEAWNLTDKVRVVLFVDFMRPLPWPVSWLNNLAVYIGSRSGFTTNVINKVKAES